MLAGRVALVTGSLDGIGFAIADALAKQGAAVMLNGFGEASLVAERVATLRAHGVGAKYHGADLAHLPQVEDLVATTVRALGPVDILVNSAVTRHWDSIEDYPTDKWELALAVNLTAPFHLMRLTMAGMKQRRWGRIINLASTYGLRGVARRADYCATKHGLIGLTQVAALEGLEFNVTCNALCPGAVDTPNTRRTLATRWAGSGKSEEEVMRAFMVGKQPSGRLVTSERVAALAVFLCSDAAADITGTPLAIDGGWLAS
ncbi:3-hydroxybutyrate dehydrogenase [Roseomonas sp. AR75]|uniref:3-hydroxybutyrate dehydrogenase n=1 Tax=Roseomonas sp. AR75 TaxID=2562311 RepID=UPI0010C0C202|nr:3-hydroxybutyrate dehydrogenase [Roseomonas sp. AR75]